MPDSKSGDVGSMPAWGAFLGVLMSDFRDYFKQRIEDSDNPRQLDYWRKELLVQLEEFVHEGEKLRLEKRDFEESKATELFKMLQTIPLYKEVKVFIPKD